MKVCIHRGSIEIGGSCVEVRAASGERLILDLGLPLDFDGQGAAGESICSSTLLPEISGLAIDSEPDPSLLGILISHPHLDHFGLLGHIRPDIPIGMGAAARRIIAAALPFLPGDWPLPAAGWDYQHQQTFAIGPFKITPYLMDHSAYDSYALLIEADGKRLFYSGDFRGHGRKGVLLDRLIADPPRPQPDVLLIEGSSLGRDELNDGGRFKTEAEIEQEMSRRMAAASGLVLVHTSSQNIDRIVTIFRACKRSQRLLLIDLYTAAILEATGNPKIPQTSWTDAVGLFIPQPQRIQIKNNGWFELLKRHSGRRVFSEELTELAAAGRAVLLFRPLHRNCLERAEALSGSVYIHSQWEGYWEKGSYDSLRYWLDEHKIPRYQIHTSGHADFEDLQALVSALQPGRVVPIHTFHPDRYPELFKNHRVELYCDGSWWDI